MSLLEPVDGPDCPKCGCPDSELLSRVQHFGATHQRRMCRHCGRTWIVPEAAAAPRVERAVIYSLIRCPRCQSSATRIYCTRRPVRYHKCDSCQHTFKSVER